MARQDKDLTDGVIALPWVQDGITEEEGNSLDQLASLAGQDRSLARTVAHLPWFLDSLTVEERKALANLSILSKDDVTLAKQAVGFPWVSDGITDQEWRTLANLRSIAHNDNPLGKTVMEYQWIPDDITEQERWAVRYLHDLAGEDTAVAKTVFEYPWVADAITENERWALRNLSGLAQLDVSLGKTTAGFPWAVNEITEDERWSLRHLRDAATQNLSLGKTLAGFPWVVDDIASHERWALSYLKDIAQEDGPVGIRLAGLSWVVDDMTENERWALRHLRDLLEQDHNLAKQLASMPFFTTSFEPHDRHALRSLLQLRDSHREKYRLLTEQKWFLDGLTDEEAALVSVLHFQAAVESDDFGKLLNNHYAHSQTIDLPLAGEIGSVSLSSRQNDLDLEATQQVEDAVRALEDFMGVPFPAGELVVLYGFAGQSYAYTTQGTEYLGRYLGTHMIVKANQARGSPTSDTNRVIIHEVAHYYWSGRVGPTWLGEGGADFLSSYVFDHLHGELLTERTKQFTASTGDFTYCNRLAIGTIKKLLEIQEQVGLEQHQASPLFICNYYLGEYLLLNLYEAIGVVPLRAAFKEIYLLAKSEGRPLTEGEIYDTFRHHTPPDKVGQFKEVYNRLHGGEFQD